MFPRISLPVFLLFLGFAAFAPVASANQKNNNAAASAAAAQKKAAEAEARQKADAERTKLAQGFYNDLHDANPGVTVDQLKTMSSDDMRRLYFHTYTAKGIPFSEAKSKADALKIWDN